MDHVDNTFEDIWVKYNGPPDNLQVTIELRKKSTKECNTLGLGLGLHIARSDNKFGVFERKNSFIRKLTQKMSNDG